jgi:hypothetical protein
MICTYRPGELRELITDDRCCEALRPGRTARTLTLTAAAALTIWAGALTFGSRTVATSTPLACCAPCPASPGSRAGRCGAPVVTEAMSGRKMVVRLRFLV